MHTVGRWVQMIFQDLISSLNPVMIIESQLLEALDVHLGLKGQAARTSARELLEAVASPTPPAGCAPIPIGLAAACTSA